VEFEWDDEKAALNVKKHGIDFDEAVTVFDDLFNIDFYDPKHSIEEQRFLVAGESNLQKLFFMNTENLNDELESEYNLSKLKVRKVGAGRKLLQENQITLDVDVAKVFPDSESVNQALRFLIRITKENQPELK
jgi:uncharacterized DUF497 family protein